MCLLACGTSSMEKTLDAHQWCGLLFIESLLRDPQPLLAICLCPALNFTGRVRVMNVTLLFEQVHANMARGEWFVGFGVHVGFGKVGNSAVKRALP